MSPAEDAIRDLLASARHDATALVEESQRLFHAAEDLRRQSEAVFARYEIANDVANALQALLGESRIEASA